jgi:glycosyltransferase involved in cell wall biosynthesis
VGFVNLANPPLVSIIVPCYNYGHLLSETLNNILEQSYANWECIIVDDGSTDNTSSVAKEFVKNYKQFSYVYQKNAGLSAARNTGLHHSKGSFIQLLDSDDFIESNKLLSQINVFVEHPNSDIVYSEVRYFSSEQQTLRRFSMNEIDNPWMPKVDSSNQQLLMSTLIDLNICVVNAPLIRKSVFDRIGFFNTKLIAVEDWEFWCRCAFQEVIFHFDNSIGTHALVRFHEGSMSKSMKRMYEAACVARKTIERFIRKMNSQEDASQLFIRNRQERIFLHKSLFEIYRDEKDLKNALKHLYSFGLISNQIRFVIKQAFLIFKMRFYDASSKG